MNNETDKIGDLFRNTLKDHHIKSDANLWNRLETQLSAQPPLSIPKTSVIRNLGWVKVAVAASFIISAALAFNYIYLPLKNAAKLADSNPSLIVTDTNQVVENFTDTSTAIVAPQPQANKNSSTKDNSNSQAIHNVFIQQPTINNTIQPDDKNQTVDNNPSTIPQRNNQPKVQQPNPIVNPTQNTVNTNKPIPQKDSIFQSLTNNYLNNNPQYPTTVNSSSLDVPKPEEIIKDTDIPNIFTPNNDGINDYFVIKNIEKCSNNQLVIKDRNGNTVFERINYQNDWDARNKADGVYFFFLKYNASGNNYGKYGSITIKR